MDVSKKEFSNLEEKLDAWIELNEYLLSSHSKEMDDGGLNYFLVPKNVKASKLNIYLSKDFRICDLGIGIYFTLGDLEITSDNNFFEIINAVKDGNLIEKIYSVGCLRVSVVGELLVSETLLSETRYNLLSFVELFTKPSEKILVYEKWLNK